MHETNWSCGCTPHRVCKVLLVIGGLNWGLIGLGTLVNSAANPWNVIHMLLSSAPVLEAIVYVLVGIAAVMNLFHSKCRQCMSCRNGTCGHGGMDGNMNKSM